MICPDRILAPRSEAFGTLLRFPERSQRAGEITVCFQCLCDPEISALDIPLEVGALASRAPPRFADCESFPVACESALFVTQIRGVGISQNVPHPLVGRSQFFLQRSVALRLLAKTVQIFQGARNQQPPGRN